MAIPTAPRLSTTQERLLGSASWAISSLRPDTTGPAPLEVHCPPGPAQLLAHTHRAPTVLLHCVPQIPAILTCARAALASLGSTEIRPTSQTSTAADSARLATTARPRQPSLQRHAPEAPSSRARVQTMRICAPNAFQASTNRMRVRLSASVVMQGPTHPHMAALRATAVLQECTARAHRQARLPLHSRRVHRCLSTMRPGRV